MRKQTTALSFIALPLVLGACSSGNHGSGMPANQNTLPTTETSAEPVDKSQQPKMGGAPGADEAAGTKK